MEVDFGKTAADYGKYRVGFPTEFFARLGRYGLASPGDRALDVGTGTGTIARGLATRGCEVWALDRAIELMRQARVFDTDAGLSIRYTHGVAEHLPCVDQAFDLVVAGQCWHWFDRPQAAAEANRVLRPGGHLVIAHFDYLTLPGNMVTATEELVLKHNPGYAMAGSTGFYTQWTPDVMAAGFGGIETFSFDIDVPYSHEAWRGRVRACHGVGASLTPEKVERFDTALKVLLQERFPDNPLHVPHRVFALFGHKAV